MEAIALSKPKTKTRLEKDIPKELIYEIDEGTPIYYRGYQEVLSGKLRIEDIMGTSKKQSFLTIQLIAKLLGFNIQRFYHLFSNELGLKFKKSQRAADIALIAKDRMTFDDIWKSEYSDTIPDIIIEIDTKASLTDMPDPANYFFKKTKQLLDNGALKVIWIFTAAETVMIAEKGKTQWAIMPWSEDVDVSHGFCFNIQKILEEYQEQ